MWHVIFDSLASSLIINAILFLIAFRLQSDKLTDISYSISFLVIDIIALANAHSIASYNLLIFLMVIAWGARLGGFLLIRVLKIGKDRRFDELRSSFIGFGKFWLGQALTAWVLMLPVTLAVFKGGTITTLVFLGVLVWATGLLIESVADYQKFAFKQDPASQGKWIESGAWKYARHPNYFGEICVWVGLYLVCFPALNWLERFICLASPVLISFVLLFVSGIPILERTAEKKWGGLPAYRTYKKRTRLLIPVPKFDKTSTP